MITASNYNGDDLNDYIKQQEKAYDYNDANNNNNGNDEIINIISKITMETEILLTDL